MHGSAALDLFRECETIETVREQLASSQNHEGEASLSRKLGKFLDLYQQVSHLGSATESQTHQR